MPIDGGVRLFERGEHWLDAMQMIYNWRLCETPKACPLIYDRSWCYQGRGAGTLLVVTAAAAAWIASGADEPTGWIKAWDGRRRKGLDDDDYE